MPRAVATTDVRSGAHRASRCGSWIGLSSAYSGGTYGANIPLARTSQFAPLCRVFDTPPHDTPWSTQPSDRGYRRNAVDAGVSEPPPNQRARSAVPEPEHELPDLAAWSGTRPARRGWRRSITSRRCSNAYRPLRASKFETKTENSAHEQENAGTAISPAFAAFVIPDGAVSNRIGRARSLTVTSTRRHTGGKHW